jgi:hypothetical protein
MPHLIDLRPGAAARRANVKQRLWVPQLLAIGERL